MTLPTAVTSCPTSAAGENIPLPHSSQGNVENSLGDPWGFACAFMLWFIFAFVECFKIQVWDFLVKVPLAEVLWGWFGNSFGFDDLAVLVAPWCCFILFP